MGDRRDILCTVIVLSILVFGSVFEKNILPSVEAPSTTLEITSVAIDGSDTFDYTVAGPTSYNPSVSTTNFGTFTGEMAVYHTFDTAEMDQSSTLQNLYVNSGTFGHNADAHGLSNRIHSSLGSDVGIIGDSSLFVANSQNQDVILGNWINLKQWNFLIDDTTKKYSINFWMKGNFNSLGVGDGAPILSAVSMQAPQNPTNFGFDLWFDENRQPRVNIWSNQSPIISLQGTNIQDDNWQMVTLIIDKKNGVNTATIWINATNPVSTNISGTFSPITGTYIAQPLLIGDSNAPSNRNDYNAKTVDFSIDDLCIIKDYDFTQADVNTLYSNGDGNPCADITGTGTSTTDIPLLSHFDLLNGINSITLPQQISSDFVIGNIINLPTDVTVTKLRLYIEASDQNSGILQAVILSNIVEGVTTAGAETIEAVSDSIDLSDPKYQAPNFFVTFNFTGANVDLSNGDVLVGIKGTSIGGGSALVFNAYNGNVGSSGESLCIDLTNPTSSYSNCNDTYLPQNFFAQNLMYEVNIEGTGTTNGVGINNREIDGVSFAHSGSFGMVGPTPVIPGMYSIQETIPAGWSLTDGSCDDFSSSFNGDTISDISIDPDNNIKCTFFNQALQPGTLKITKLTTGGDGTFDFTVAGPTSYNPIINTVGEGSFTTLVDSTSFAIDQDVAIERVGEHDLGQLMSFSGQSISRLTFPSVNSLDITDGSPGTVNAVIYSGVADGSPDFTVLGTSVETYQAPWENDGAGGSIAGNADHNLVFTFNPPVTVSGSDIFVGIHQVGLGTLPNSHFSIEEVNFDVGLGNEGKCIQRDVEDNPSFTTAEICGFGPAHDILMKIESSTGTGMVGPTPVIPGMYSIQESIPAGWNLTTATCNDGSSSFSVDTVSGILIGPDNNIECIFENTSVVPTNDNDSDGISNDVDTLPNTPSDDFSDIALGGTSSGTITTRGTQILTITEEPNPAGVRINADISGGVTQATVSLCGGIATSNFNPGNEIVVTCGSVIIKTISGEVEVVFIASDGTQASTSIPSGNEITFEPQTSIITANPDNTDTIIIMSGNTLIPISPGSSDYTDITPPQITINSLINDGNSFYFGTIPPAPTCTAQDVLSGINGNCSVTGYQTGVGTHQIQFSASDLAGNTNTITIHYQILPWSMLGFYPPVDMNGIVNTVKGGSTVPLKFQVFSGSIEKTSTSDISSFTQNTISCSALVGNPEDAIEITTNDLTGLKYTGGQFHANWKTPKSPNTCWKVKVVTIDGSSLSAFFKLK